MRYQLHVWHAQYLQPRVASWAATDSAHAL